MKLLKRIVQIAALTLACSALLLPMSALAQEEAGAIAACLKAWDKHPFGGNPRYKTLQTSVKVFGVGKSTRDAETTSTPTLILVNAGVNVMGGSTIELLNPNGWYCLRATVNVMGGLNIRAHCRAHLASATDGATVMGSNTENKGVTVMGSTRVERVDCS